MTEPEIGESISTFVDCSQQITGKAIHLAVVLATEFSGVPNPGESESPRARHQ
jgi:hypothetical protein